MPHISHMSSKKEAASGLLQINVSFLA